MPRFLLLTLLWTRSSTVASLFPNPVDTVFRPEFWTSLFHLTSWPSPFHNNTFSLFSWLFHCLLLLDILSSDLYRLVFSSVPWPHGFSHYTVTWASSSVFYIPTITWMLFLVQIFLLSSHSHMSANYWKTAPGCPTCLTFSMSHLAPLLYCQIFFLTILLMPLSIPYPHNQLPCILKSTS